MSNASTEEAQRQAEIAWAAGLFEGEGCVFCSGTHSAEMTLSMSDKDRVERFAEVMGFGTVGHVNPAQDGWKDMWKWRCEVRNLQQAVEMLWPWLGPRRQEQARSALLAHQDHAARNLLAPRPCPNGCGLVTRPGPLARHLKSKRCG